MAYGANRACGELTAGIGAGFGITAHGLVGALMDGAKQTAAAADRARVEQVAKQNRHAALAARARLGVARETAAELRERLAAAEEDISILMSENARLKSALAAATRSA